MLRKKKYGYILLASLIVSGLAGTPRNNSLNKNERRLAVELMKDTKTDVLNAVKELSEDQLNFRPAADKRSIRECLYHIATAEKNLWEIMEKSLKSAANPEKRREINLTDEELVQMVTDNNQPVKLMEIFLPENSTHRLHNEPLSVFKAARTDHIKYIKNTTEDLRNHVVQTPIGYLDCYQLCLLIAANSKRCIQQINEIKSSAGFPN